MDEVPTSTGDGGARRDLFLASFLVLFLELACIRWFPAHVLYLTFFTNTVLLASFLGMSIGCLAAPRATSWIGLTPAILALAMGAALAVEPLRGHVLADTGDPASPEVIYFGVTTRTPEVHFFVPVEVLCAVFFVAVALALAGPGQELGRAFARVEGRIAAYTVNVAGSIAGIVLFSACSLLELPPFFWFAPIALVTGWFALRETASPGRRVLVVAPLAVVLAFTQWTAGRMLDGLRPVGTHRWSPYYRVDYVNHPQVPYFIRVNLIGHQQMVPAVARSALIPPALAYSIPHLLQRDVGRPRFEDVLVIGAGSGNDVSRALQWGARHVDAVEIDPAIHRLGVEHHPDQPYADPRVTVHIDDGRRFLGRTERKYDLIVFALVDSLVLHSGYSSLRLESYLFTREALASVKRCLEPDGVFVCYNVFRHGWLVGRLHDGLAEVFGRPPLVLALPPVAQVKPTDTLEGFTAFFAGSTGPFEAGFGRHGGYWVRRDRLPEPSSEPGFPGPAAPDKSWSKLVPASITSAGLEMASDDWPFLYLRDRAIPGLSLRGVAVMAALAGVLLALFAPRGASSATSPPGIGRRLFFLGAGFMLVETRAVVQAALLLGSTWIVNSLVFLAVLLAILAANLFVLRAKPRSVAPFYAGLFAALAVNALVPLDALFDFSRPVQLALASLLVFTPILFAGVVFALTFSRSAAPDRDVALNVAGAIAGGLAEYASMVVGFRALALVAIGLYALSAVPVAEPSDPAKA